MLDLKIVAALDVIVNMAKGLTKGNLSSYCALDATIPDDQKMIAKDGSFASVIELYGSNNIVGPEEMERMVESFSTSIAPSMRESGHQIQFVFCRDKDRIIDEVKNTLEPMIERAKIIGMYVDDLIEAKIKSVSDKGTYESCFIVLWTRPAVEKMNLKEQRKDIVDEKMSMPPAIGSQDIFNYLESIDVKHTAFLETVKTGLNGGNLLYEVLNVKEAILEIKKSINHSLVSNNWSPYTIKDKPPIVDIDTVLRSEVDVGAGLWPSLSEQVFPIDGEKISSDTIRFGDKYIASMGVTLPPKTPRVMFERLINSINADIPYQISIMIEGGGLKSMSLKGLAAALLVITSKINNMAIKESIEIMEAYEGKGNVVIKGSINASTWCDHPDPKEAQKILSSRKERLLKSLQSWGDIEAKLTTSDPFESFLSTVPAITYKQEAPSFCIPVDEMSYILPLTRSAKIWKTGSIINLSADGKISPYQTMSSLQNTWNTIIFATPGLGKSARINNENMATILSPSPDSEIPYIGILDVGPSSNGLIKSLKARFPANKRHLFVYKKLQNTLDYSMNVFDTYPGIRTATPSDKSFLVNFISTIIGADDETFPIDKMVSKVIDLTYERYSDSATGSPKRYIASVSDEVDDELKRLKIDMSGNKSWWYVVDELFKNGARHESKLAQRFAVPLLEDCITIAQSESQIKSIYDKPILSTGETALQFFCRSISESISMYPIISQHTVFDLGDAKVISLDLNDVGKTSGSKTDNKRAATMYMLGRYIIGKSIKQDESLILLSPKLYKEYHRKNVEISKTLIKKICIDEFHNAAKIPSFVSQVITDMREGRKWNLEIVLASQYYTDFADDIIDAATTIQMLSGGDVSKKIGEKFNLNQTTINILRTRLNGLSPMGVPYIFKVITKKGSFIQFLYNLMSPLEILSYSTTSEDNRLLDTLSEKIGYLNAIAEISRIYPSGFKSHIEANVTNIDDGYSIYEREASRIADRFSDKR